MASRLFVCLFVICILGFVTAQPNTVKDFTIRRLRNAITGAFTCADAKSSAFDAQTQILFIGCSDKKVLYFFLGNETIINSKTTPQAPDFMDIDPANGMLYIGSKAGKNVVTLDTRTPSAAAVERYVQGQELTTLLVDKISVLSGGFRYVYWGLKDKTFVRQKTSAAATWPGTDRVTTTLSDKLASASIDFTTNNGIFGAERGGPIYLVNLVVSNPNALLSSFITTFPDSAILGNIQTILGYTKGSKSVTISGQDSGIGLVRDQVTGKIDNIFVLDPSPLTASALDYNRGVSYWGTKDGGLARVHLDDFNVYAALNPACWAFSGAAPCNVSKSIIDIHYDSVRDRVVFLMEGDAATNINYGIVESNCTLLTDCGSCSSDPYFCGWCYDANNCLQQSSCPISSEWANPLQNNITCPSYNPASPTFSPFSGGSLVTVSGDLHLKASSGVSCRFGNATAVSSTFINSNSVTCVAPNYGRVARTFVRLESQGRPWGGSGSTDFEFVDCNSATTCSDCILFRSSFPSCGWCFETNRCGNQGNCTSFLQNVCPSLLSLSPLSSKSSGGAPGLIQGSQFLPSSNYTIQVGDVGIFQAQYVNSSFISFVVPGLGSASTGSKQVSVFQDGIVYSNSNLTLIYYSCGDSLFCTSCNTLLQPDCSWCATQGVCSDTCTDGSTPATPCPGITNISPSVDHSSGGTLINLTMPFFISGDVYSVTFSAGNTVITQAANYSSPTTIQTITPSFPGGTTSVNVVVNYEDQPYSAGTFPFGIYDCLSDCQGCANPNKPRCGWCSQFSTCTVGSFCPSDLITVCETAQAEKKSNTTVVVAVVVVVLAVLLILGIILVLLLLRRNRNNTGRTPPLPNPPNFQEVAFAFDNTPIFNAPKSLQLTKFEDALTKDPEFKLALALLASCDNADHDKMSKYLTFTILNHNTASFISFIKILIAQELDAQQETTLFRANSVATKTFAVFAKVHGLKYLWDTLAKSIWEMYCKSQESQDIELADSSQTSILSASLDIDLENDPNAVANSYQLLLSLTQVFNLIDKSANSVPLPFCEIFSFISTSVNQKFGVKSAHKGVGAFFFLRFVCPSFVTPNVYGLLKSHPDKPLQKNLLSLSRILQNLANETYPGKKSPQLQKVDQFIDENLDRLHKFYDKITSTSEKPQPASASIPSVVHDNSLYWLHNYALSKTKALSASPIGFDKSVLSTLGPEPIQTK